MDTENRSPNTSTSTLPQQTKGFFASASGSRRQSIGSASGGSSPQIPQGIGYSPAPSTPNGPAGSGLPAFRTLRSLLQFGPQKDGHQNKSSTSSPRSPFSSFGSVRKSIAKQRERKASLSEDALAPVMAIERSEGSELPIRRSVSLSRLEKPLPREPSEDSLRDGRTGDNMRNTDFQRRTPSPVPPLPAELSTILEADNSGMSRMSREDNKRSPSPPHIVIQDFLHPNRGMPVTPNNRTRSSSIDELDVSALNLSTSEVAKDVRDALRRSTGSSQSGEDWQTANKVAVIIDGDAHPEVADKTFNVDGMDSDLMALLQSKAGGKDYSSPPKRHSPSTPTFPPSPSSPLSGHRRTSSFLPRLRSTNSTSPSPTPTSSHFSIQTPSPTTATLSTITPKASPAKPQGPVIAVNGGDSSPSSPTAGVPSMSTSTPVSNRRLLNLPPASRMFRTTSARNEDSGETSNSISMRQPARTLREVMLGSRNGMKTGADESPSQGTSTPLGRGSLDSRRTPSTSSYASELGLGRPSLEIRRGGTPTVDARLLRPSFSRHVTPPSHYDDRAMSEADLTLSTDVQRARVSYDPIARPASSAGTRDLPESRRTTSLRVPPGATSASGSGSGRISPGQRGPPSTRHRMRSMSVQEQIATLRLNNGLDDGEGSSSSGVPRPGSSLSVLGARGSRGVVRDTSPGVGSGPKAEWLGPRTAKAFKAAGLLDFDREKEAEQSSSSSRDFSSSAGGGWRPTRDRSGSAGAGAIPSPSAIIAGSAAGLSGTRMPGTMRSASEFNPGHTRALSRMAFSESGGGSGGIPGRRGSGSYSSVYGSSSYGRGSGSSYGGYNGLMESPTFTVSTSSRERDAPKSATSTAPTSVSESFGYLGRDRAERDKEKEREREREEMKEMKEKHSTEMAALLSALSDSQRTARMLREENAQLRDRLEDFSALVQENENLRHAYDSVDRECVSLRRELSALRAVKAPGMSPSWSGSSGTSSFRSATARGSPLVTDSTPRYNPAGQEAEEEQYNDTVIIHHSVDTGFPSYLDNNNYKDEQDEEVDESAARPSQDGLYPPSSTSTPLKRRSSNSSSIFPIPPPNMTMLMHDEMASQLVTSNKSNADQSQYPFTFLPSPAPRRGGSGNNRAPSTSHSQVQAHPPLHISLSSSTYSSSSQQHQYQQSLTYSNSNRNGTTTITNSGHALNQSINSTTSISPTTANFSMTTGSPGSLRLRPEHELLLGDMESLDLGARSVGSESSNNRVSGDDALW
ncbi:hypothetical protein CPC08DRAFT_814965 [Agrocybe pediades]|nr:hypothetical protein CPC08DRAFT_814965 [Agrocybe pediades]